MKHFSGVEFNVATRFEFIQISIRRLSEILMARREADEMTLLRGVAVFVLIKRKFIDEIHKIVYW
jgi:hypothetical protein